MWRDAALTRAFALGAEISLPTGDEERGTGRGELAGEVFLAYSRSFSDVDLHLNLGVELEEEREPGGEDELEAELEYGVAFEWELAGETAVMAALVGESGDDGSELSLIPGVEWEWEWERSELVFGLGVPIGLTGESDDWGVIGVLEIELMLGEGR